MERWRDGREENGRQRIVEGVRENGNNWWMGDRWREGQGKGRCREARGTTSETSGTGKRVRYWRKERGRKRERRVEGERKGKRAIIGGACDWLDDE